MPVAPYSKPGYGVRDGSAVGRAYAEGTEHGD